jgi:hypothetical protein
MIYLSGKITDKSLEKTQSNILRFYEKARELEDLGHKVFNPADHETPNMEWEQYLAEDLCWIYKNKPDTMYMMSNWKNSLGARLEREVAIRLGMRIIYEK